MKQPRCKLVFGSESWRIELKDQQGNNLKKQMILLIMKVVFIPLSADASVPCSGRFVNPISDICWSCLLPLSIGPVNIGGGLAPAKRDTDNPSNPVCMCMKQVPPSPVDVPVPGVTIGFWEPVRLVDITRTPYCMTGMGGMQLGKANHTKVSSYNRSYGKRVAHNSFYHVHYYIYPLIYWLELITDLICLEQSTFDVAYLSELDPSWNDHKLQTLLTPEAFLFGNPIAQAACALDCTAATLDKPRDELFWCSGCWGNLYPLSGANADHIGGVQSSSLYTARVLTKMHRMGLAKETSTDDGSIDGKLCKKSIAPKIKKSQYKLQMVYPRPSSGDIGCWPIGLSDMLYSAFNEYPYDGQDWSYLIWRKTNCCAF